MDFETDFAEINKKDLKEYVSANFYKIRECLDYEDEYKTCKSWRGRLNEYFVHGNFRNCSNFKKDYKNCRKCLSGNTEACVEVIKSADDVIERRMKAHMANDVWKRRTEPPEEWNKPLPDELQKDSFKSLSKMEKKVKNDECTIL